MQQFENPEAGRQSALSPNPAIAMTARHIDPWAVLAGAIITSAIGLVFTGFGTALGMTALSAEPAEGSALWALALTAGWILLTLVVSNATGAYVAGRMRRQYEPAQPEEVRLRDGMNGLVVWGLGIIASAVVLATAVNTTSSTARDVTSAATQTTGAPLAQMTGATGGTGQGAATDAQQAGDEPPRVDPMVLMARQLLRPETVTPVTAGRIGTEAEVAMLLDRAATDGTLSDEDRSYLVAVTVARTGLDQPAAEARVDQMLETARTAQEEQATAARIEEETAQQAAETARISAILTAFLITAASLVAAVAAYGAAIAGGRHRDEGRVFGGLAWPR